MDELGRQEFIIDNSFEDQKPVINEEAVDQKNVVTNDHGDNSSDPSKEREVRGPPTTEEEMRQCKYCEFSAENWPMFVKHVFKPQHIKKVAEAYKMKFASNFTCEVCSITCCGHLPFNAHILGAKHRKALDKIAAEKANSTGGGPIKNNQFGNKQSKKPYDKVQNPAKSSNVKAIGAQIFANYQQPLIGLEYVTEVQVTGQNPRYECSLCDAKFEHDLKFPHLVGQKHRMNVLKIKRPDFVKELHPASKKRSELTALLLRESLEVELTEGRKEVRTRVEKPPPESASSTVGQDASLSRGGNRGGAHAGSGKRGGRGNTGFGQQGSWSNKETSYSRGMAGGRVVKMGGGGGSWSSYGSYGNDKYGSFGSSDKFAYGMPYNSSLDKPNYERSYQQSSSFDQTYPERESTYYGQARDNIGERYSPTSPQMEPHGSFDIQPKFKKEISSGLASAIGDLTRLVKNEDDASVALQVSNALTKALLQYRMDDLNS